jgi:hypothetical protein
MLGCVQDVSRWTHVRFGRVACESEAALDSSTDCVQCTQSVLPSRLAPASQVTLLTSVQRETSWTHPNLPAQTSQSSAGPHRQTSQHFWGSKSVCVAPRCKLSLGINTSPCPPTHQPISHASTQVNDPAECRSASGRRRTAADQPACAEDRRRRLR